MSISHSISTPMICPKCKYEYELEVWQIVDIEERPDLSELIIDGSLRIAVCDQYYSSADFEVGLLVLQKVKKSHLSISPHSHSTQEQDLKLAGYLIHTLKVKSGNKWQEEWLREGVPRVPSELIPFAMEKGIETAYQTKQQRQRAFADQINQQFKTINDQLSPELRKKHIKLLNEANNKEEFYKLLQNDPDLADVLQRIIANSNNTSNSTLLDEIMDKINQAKQLHDIYQTKGDIKVLEELTNLFESILSSQNISS